MKIKIIAVLLCAAPLLLRAQGEIGTVLAQVESNNAELNSLRELTRARVVGERVGNSLEDPEVGYEHVWGKQKALGKSGELTVMQSFDFPTVYAQRNRLSRERARQYGYEYESERIRILYEAKSLCIEIIALRRERELLHSAAENASRITEALHTSIETGSSGVIELNRAALELASAAGELARTEAALEAALKTLAGLNGGVMPHSIPEDFPERVELPDAESFVSIYTTGSPFVLAARSEAEAAARDVRLSRQMGLPKFGVGYKHEFSTGEKFNGIAAGMTIPVFGNRNNVRRARAEQAYARSRVTAVENEQETAVRRLHAEAVALSNSIATYEQILAEVVSGGALDKALANGYLSVLDYFNETSVILDTQLSLTETLREYHNIQAELYSFEL